MTHWGFWRRWDKPFEVTVFKGDRRPKGIIVHRRKLWPGDTRVHQGIRVTSPARTMIDTAPRLTDDQLGRYVNRGLHEHLLYLGSLGEQLARNPNHPATKRLLKFVLTKDGPTRSDWERMLFPWCDRFDLPRPLMAQWIGPYEVDAVYPAERLVLELDSWEFHNTQIDFEANRERDADLLELGYETVRLTWDRMITKAAREAQRLGRILARRRREAA
jgi:hypothetical protein